MGSRKRFVSHSIRVGSPRFRHGNDPAFPSREFHCHAAGANNKLIVPGTILRLAFGGRVLAGMGSLVRRHVSLYNRRLTRLILSFLLLFQSADQSSRTRIVREVDTFFTRSRVAPLKERLLLLLRIRPSLRITLRP